MSRRSRRRARRARIMRRWRVKLARAYARMESAHCETMNLGWLAAAADAGTALDALERLGRPARMPPECS